VPKINPDTHRLTVDGLVKTEKSWSLSELEKEFEKKEIVAALQVGFNCLGSDVSGHIEVE
jgi:DMSO/TMAO reductase YedYZ molybdopterin-dependent catalytic subunit